MAEIGEVVEFVVRGAPVPQPRHKVGVGFHGKPDAYIDRKHPIHAWKQQVWAAARGAWAGPPASGPFRCDAVFVLPRPTRTARRHRRLYSFTRPDVDNFHKAALDAMGGLVWHDDGQVACGLIAKVTAAAGEAPHAVFRIQRLDPSDESANYPLDVLPQAGDVG